MQRIRFKAISPNQINDKNLRSRWKLMMRLSKKSYKIALGYRKKLDELVVKNKSEKDLVSEADEAIETLLRRLILKQFPIDGIMGEELPDHEGGDYRWVIDPIDGTTSFVRGQWHYSISIALEYRGQLMLAMVSAPELGHFFSAVRGKGALLNGKPITVSSRELMAEAVFTTGFACLRKGQNESNLNYFPYFAKELMSSRRFGSAALDCCYVAMGVLDGFWELGLNYYDIAAGILIAEEAGAMASDFNGESKKIPYEILVANKKLHQLSLGIITKVRNEILKRD